MASQSMTSDEKALIALLIAAFLLSKADTKDMAAAILVGRVASMKASYAQASDAVGAETDWEPSDDLQGTAKDISEQDAESIAATYESELTNVTEAFVSSWMNSHENLDGCESAARSELATWATTRAAWKSEQIADWTCGSGADDGMDAWIADLIDEDIELPEDISLDDIEVTVLPEDASCDECKDVAGKSFDIAEYDDIDEMPLHSGCGHRKVVQMK